MVTSPREQAASALDVDLDQSRRTVPEHRWEEFKKDSEKCRKVVQKPQQSRLNPKSLPFCNIGFLPI